MAPTLEQQIEINGLLLGPGTPWLMDTFNFWTRSIRALQQGPRAWRDGEMSGAEWYNSITVPVTVAVTGPTVAACLDNLQTLSAALQPIRDEETELDVLFRQGGFNYLMRVRPRGFNVNTFAVANGFIPVQLGMVSLDWRYYSADLHTVGPITPPEHAGGLLLPLLLPVHTGGTLVGGEAGLVNAGLVDTNLLIRLDGELTAGSRVILNRADGVQQQLQILFTINQGQWLDIDSEKGTVLLNGLISANRFGDVTGDLPIASAGANEIRLTSPNGTSDSGFMTVSWRDAWT